MREVRTLPAQRHTNAWVNTAAQHLRNECYYRDLVRQIGEMFGDEAFISDDGSRQQDVLCAKVPELVRRLLDNQSKERTLTEQVSQESTLSHESNLKTQ